MAQGKLKPNQTWGRKTAKHRRYVTSGPPRDIVGIRDQENIHNPYQRKELEQIEGQHQEKFLGSKDHKIPDSIIPPLNGRIVPRRSALWYAGRAANAAKQRDFAYAYHLFLAASNVKKNTIAQARRWMASADSNLKHYQRQVGNT